MPVTATGFTPGSLVTIRTANSISPTPKYLTSGTADASRNLRGDGLPAVLRPVQRQLQTFRLAAGDSVNPAIAAFATYQQVDVGYKTNPATGRPTRQATHTVRGFPVGKTTYLHFRFAGKTRRNVKLGAHERAVRDRLQADAAAADALAPGQVDGLRRPVRRPTTRTTKPQLKYSFVITRTFGT